MKSAVFFDRDGVLNRALVRNGKPYPPASVQELEIFPGAARQLERLRKLGLLLIVITNQPDVARGTQTKREVDAINDRLRGELPVDDIVTCYHTDSDDCSCRKPKPGMLLEAAAKHGIRLIDSYMVGDRWRDIDAGDAAGVKTVFIDYGYAERGPSRTPQATVSSLAEAVEWICADCSSTKRN